MTATLTNTPTVASTAASGATGRITDHWVVKPPSARITASANVPRTWVRSASSKREPEPGLPERQADREVDQQAGQPRPRRHPYRRDRGEQHGRAHEDDRR